MSEDTIMMFFIGGMILCLILILIVGICCLCKFTGGKFLKWYEKKEQEEIEDGSIGDR